MYEAFLISKGGELRRVGTPHEQRNLEAQGWQLVPEGEYLRLLSFAENKRLKAELADMQNTLDYYVKRFGGFVRLEEK